LILLDFKPLPQRLNLIVQRLDLGHPRV
jgi:hypothetical protein